MTMNNYFLDSYSINAWQILAFPISSPYAHKHLEKVDSSPSFTSKAVHTVLGLVEVFPVAGSLVSLMEMVIHVVLKVLIPHKTEPTSQENLGSTEVISNLQPREVTPILLIDKDYTENSKRLIEFFSTNFPQTIFIKDKIVGQTADDLKKYHGVDNLKAINEQYKGHCAFFQVIHIISRLSEGALSEDSYESLEKELGFKIHILAYKTNSIANVFSNKGSISIVQATFTIDSSYSTKETIQAPQEFKKAICNILKTIEDQV